MVILLEKQITVRLRDYKLESLDKVKEQLWLSGRASVLLIEGRWCESPGLHVKVSLGKILNPKLLLICGSAPTMQGLWMNRCMKPKAKTFVIAL